MGKAENAGDQHFSLLPTMFSTLLKTKFNFSAKLNLSSANAFDLEQSKNVTFGKQLISSHLDRINYSLTVDYYDARKLPVAQKEYCVEYW